MTHESYHAQVGAYAGWKRKESKSKAGSYYLVGPGGEKVWEKEALRKAKEAAKVEAAREAEVARDAEMAEGGPAMWRRRWAEAAALAGLSFAAGALAAWGLGGQRRLASR